jgi:hypothetical protein
MAGSVFSKVPMASRMGLDSLASRTRMRVAMVGEYDILGYAVYAVQFCTRNKKADLATVSSTWFRADNVSKPCEHPRIGVVGAQVFFG